MKRFKIKWEIGQYGESEEIIEAETLEQAEQQAYEACRDEAESYMNYSAKEITS